MKQYLDLMRRIVETGNLKGDRTGTGTRSVFGGQMRFDLKNNLLPLVTTKKVFTRGLIEELLWFLRGSTNNEELAALNVSIWDGWALKEDHTVTRVLEGYELAERYAEKLGIPLQMARQRLAALSNGEGGSMEIAKQHLIDNGIELTERHVLFFKGELGPIYGKQWRAWEAPGGRRIDQIAEVIDLLKNNPNSRRMIVTAWNPADLPDESISPQENVKLGRQSLASCHCLFQFYARPLSQQERLNILQQRIASGQFEYTGPTESMDQHLDEQNIPKHGLSCQLYQRSCDYFLGVPFNIASYAILTAMIAQVVNMVPDEFVWTGGDIHLYNNHPEQVETQLSREPRALPTLHIDPSVKHIDDFRIEHFEIRGYDPWPTIKAKVSV